MRHADHNLTQVRCLPARIGASFAAFLVLGLLLAAPASATFEQVGTFPGGGSTRLLAKASSMAVNVTGAGGVPAGTFYSVADDGNNETERVVRFNPKGEFSEAWGWGVGNEKEEFQRCGPDGEAAYPVCFTGRGGEGLGQLNNPRGIAIDQSTGNVYVTNVYRKQDNVQVFNADGSQLLGGFGELGATPPYPAPAESIAEGPEKFHGSGTSNIAVDDSGTVYILDGDSNNALPPHESRVMVFKPQNPGDYEHYVYTGSENDIAASHGEASFRPEHLTIDDAGNLYLSNEKRISEFVAGEPETPACNYTAAGMYGMTVNPISGEVFYFSYQNKKIHQLSACDPEGELKETGAFTVTPKADAIYALAFDPVHSYDLARPAGILYGANPVIGGSIGSITGLGYIFAAPEVHNPAVEAESASLVGSSTATLGAQINPKGNPTRYAFQYLTAAEYEANEPADRFAGAAEAPLGSGALGTGQEAISAAVALSGLQPDTEYRYRAVATSNCNPEEEEEVCEGVGAAQAFRTFPVEAPGLRDGRAYELVSPADKHGGEVFPADPGLDSCPIAECKPGLSSSHFPMQSSPDGDAVTYEGYPFSFGGGAVSENQYVSRRDAKTGWQTTTLSPALARRGSPQGYKAFNPGLTMGLLYQVAPSLTPEAPSEYANLYTQPTTNPLALSPLLGQEPPNRASGGGTNGLVLTYADASADFSRIFFEANDALTVETPFAPEAVNGGEYKKNLYEWAGGQLRLVNVAPGNTETAPGAEFGSGGKLSPGGNLHIQDFSHAISADGSRVFWSDEAGQVYLREDAEVTKAIPDPGKFLTASADGSKVLLSNGHLYALEGETTTDLTNGNGGFQGILGQSEDLSHVYFVDTAALTGEEENDHGAKAQAGKDNLYAWDEGTTRFVATLLAQDNPAGEGDGIGDWKATPTWRTAEASPNGRWVAFLSRAPLSDYDNTGPCEPIPSSGGEFHQAPCNEVFLYDSAAGELTCASCNPSGERPLGPSTLRLIQGADGSQLQPRYLTDSGRLYFDSQDSLTPFDTNDGVEDVYQYEPKGIGSCEREKGCVSLISAGHEPVDSNFLAMDESGRNVFFTTRDQLTLKDKDELIDLYDAREGGGIPSETEVGRGECQGETCQTQVSAPNDPTPGSSSFEGAGNVDEQQTAKKHKKKKHAKKHKGKGKAAHQRAKHNRGGAK